jgi:hypothetical protein
MRLFAVTQILGREAVNEWSFQTSMWKTVAAGVFVIARVVSGFRRITMFETKPRPAGKMPN